MTAAANVVSLPGFATGIWPATTRLDPRRRDLGRRPTTQRAGQATRHACLRAGRGRCPRSAAASTGHALPGAEIAYAGKAFLCRAVAAGSARKGSALDVCSAGELAVARSAGFPAERILLHGNAKTPEDLQAAIGYGVGRIVLDSARRDRQARALLSAGPASGCWSASRPGSTRHPPGRGTGVEDQKFGFAISSGAAADAVGRVLRQPGLRAGRPALPPRLADHPLDAFELAARGLHRPDGGGARRARRDPARTRPRRRPRRPLHRGDPDFDLPGFAAPDRGWHPGRLRLAAAAGAADDRRAGPGDHQPGDGHAVPGA